MKHLQLAHLESQILSYLIITDRAFQDPYWKPNAKLWVLSPAFKLLNCSRSFKDDHPIQALMMMSRAFLLGCAINRPSAGVE